MSKHSIFGCKIHCSAMDFNPWQILGNGVRILAGSLGVETPKKKMGRPFGAQG